MKKLLASIFMMLTLLWAGNAWAPPPAPNKSVWLDTECNQAKYFPLGTLCQDTDDGKLYKGTGAAVVELAAGASGDMTKAVYDVDTDNKIDAAKGGTDMDTSASTGTPYVTGGTWSVENAATMRTNLGLVIGTNVQAYDADLTTYAGITPSANVQSMLAAADYAGIRTLLGLVIGTNVQAYDADLTTYAGITPSANIQTFLGAADYAAMRTQLSLVPGTNVQAYDADLATLAAPTAWRIFYSNGTSVITQLALGADGTFLRSNGAAVAPTFSVPGGAGDVVGGALSADGEMVVYNGVSGKIIKQSGLGAGMVKLSAAAVPSIATPGTDYVAVDADLTTLASPTAWRVFYSNGTSVITELPLGVDGTFLRSNGAAAAPTFAVPGGAGDVISVGDCASGACNDETSDGGTYIGLYSASGAVRLRNNAGVMEARTAADAGYANFKAAGFESELAAGSVGYIRIKEDPANGANYRAFSVASSLAEDLTYTWPTGLPTANDFFVLGTPAAGISTLSYSSLPRLMDTTLGNTRGSILYRGAAGWTILVPGTAGHVLKSAGAGADPLYAAETAAAGGAATNVQYNTGGALDGEAAFTYNAATDTLTAVNIAGNLVGGLTASSAVIPNAANTLALGSAAAEWSDLFLGDGAIIYGQNDQSATLTSSASTWTASNFVSSGTTKTTGALSPAVAGATTVGTLLLPYSSAYIGNAATNNIQLTGVGTGSRIATFPDVSGTVNVSPTVGTADHMYMSTATAGLGKWSTPTYPSASGTAGQILRSDATNNVYTTSTFADTYAIGTLLVASGANVVTGLTAGATTEILVGGGAAVPVWTTGTGTGAPVRGSSPTITGATLITPAIGAATGTSLMATGRVDGTTGMLISTAASATTVVIATHGHTSYFMNIGDNAAHSIFTLPTAEAGLQYCFKNYTGITQVLTIQTSAAGQYIDLDGTNTATGGFIHSGGAAGDGACVVGVDATHWVAYKNLGTWTVD